MPVRLRVALGALVVVLLSPAVAALTAPPAAADPVQRPVTAKDYFSLYSGGDYRVDVLANDSTTFLSGGELTVCGVDVAPADRRVLYAEPDGDRVFVETKPSAAGKVSFTYDACQGDQRETNRVTLNLVHLAAPKVAKYAHKRGRLKVTNPNPAKVMIQWGSNTNASRDGHRGLPARTTVGIRVKRHRIFWVAYVVDRGTLVIAGDGTINNIRLSQQR